MIGGHEAAGVASSFQDPPTASIEVWIHLVELIELHLQMKTLGRFQFVLVLLDEVLVTFVIGR